MEQIKTVETFRAWRRGISGAVGLVPTMGALHGGHLSLVEASVLRCDHTVVSIFVNPTQFGPGEDLSSYPRTLARDLNALIKRGVSAVFLPTDEDMYGPGYSTYVLEDQLSRLLEGNSRPAHFRGVTTVVAKLFNIVQPTLAFFGRKDAQQLRIIRKMTLDLNFPVMIVDCPTLREASGLALSSRNDYLSSEIRERAAIIYQALKEGQTLFDQGERSAENIRNTVTALIETEPLAKIDYVSVADDTTLNELDGELLAPALLSVAVFFGFTRLIDNITLIPNSPNP